MNRLLSIVLAVVACVGASPARAQAPHDPARLFPHEAPVALPASTGLVRLALPASVLERCRPDLSDVRIHDEAGLARAYMVESSARRPGEATVYAITPSEMSHRIERRTSLAPIYREHLELTPPPQVHEGRWTLWLDSAQPRFVRDVVVYEVRGDERAEIATATIFRMQAPLRDRLGVELPRIAEGARLEVQISGEGGYLEPTVSLVVLTVPQEPPTVALPLVASSRVVREGRTVIELDRPSGIVADRIRFVTESSNFHREVRVLDLRPGEPAREVAHGALFRVRELEGAERMTLDVGRAVGDRLRIEIDDGDSPPLEDITFEAIVRQPTLVFESVGSPVVLRFGGGRAQAPRYDMQRLVGTRLGDRLLESALPEATLGETTPNPRFDDGPALAFAMRAGRAPDAIAFTHVADLEVADAIEGLSRVRLPPSVLAAGRDDLADVRIIDMDGAQWPYLRGADAPDPVTVTVRVAEGTSGSESTYAIGFPSAPLRPERLALSTDAPYVSRTYRLYGLDAEGQRVLLGSGFLTREPNEVRPIELGWAPRRVHGLELVVQDGSDAPLVIGQATAWVSSPTLYLAAPDGGYRILVGSPESEPPRYEIEAARELVLSVRAATARVDDASANPLHVEPPVESEGLSGWIVWIVLLFAILVLGLLTWRVVRQSSSGDDPPAPKPPEEAAEPPVQF